MWKTLIKGYQILCSIVAWMLVFCIVIGNFPADAIYMPIFYLLMSGKYMFEPFVMWFRKPSYHDLIIGELFYNDEKRELKVREKVYSYDYIVDCYIEVDDETSSDFVIETKYKPSLIGTFLGAESGGFTGALVGGWTLGKTEVTWGNVEEGYCHSLKLFIEFENNEIEEINLISSTVNHESYLYNNKSKACIRSYNKIQQIIQDNEKTTILISSLSSRQAK